MFPYFCAFCRKGHLYFFCLLLFMRKGKHCVRNNEELRGNLYALFLSLVRKKKMPKRKDPGCARRATPDDHLPKGQKLAPLRQSALLYGIRPSSASRPPVNAGSHAALDTVLTRGRDVACRVLQAIRPDAQRRMAAPKRRGVKRRVRFCVKNGRLSERSEFPAV